MRAKPPRHHPDHRSLPHYAHLLTTIHLHICSPTCYLGTPSAPPYKPDPVHPRLSVVPLPSPRTIQLQHTRAVRRGAASCRAVLGSCPVAAAVRAAAQVSSPRSRPG